MSPLPTATVPPPGFLAKYWFLILLLALVMLGVLAGLWMARLRRARPLPRRNGISPLKLTQLAVLIAGQTRAPALIDEWRSHLAGEADQDLTRAEQMRAACGFLRAGVCYRRQDAADLWWKLGDKLLASRRWSNAAVWGPTLCAVVMVIRRDGLYGVVANYESLASLCGSLFLAIRFGRKWRGVKPPQHKPQHDK